MVKRAYGVDDRVARDEELRRRQATQLLRSGLARAAAVEGSGDDLRPSLKLSIPIELVGDDDTAAFVASDRVLVPANRLDEAARIVRDDLQLGEGDVVAKQIAGIPWGEVRTPYRAIPVETRDRLTGDEIHGQRNHVMFAASYRFKVREGEDPERALLPRHQGGGPGEHSTVAILDTGLARTAQYDPWLADVASVVADLDVDLLRVSGDPSDELDFGAGHGTFVAGIVRQIAPSARIHIVRVLDSNGTGLESEVARGIERAVSLEPDVILCAFGGYSIGDEAPVAVEAAIAGIPKHILVIAAAGNERQDRRPIWPASCRGVEAIAALESGDDGTLHVSKGEAHLTWYSNTGPDVRYAAPGTWTSSFVSGQESAARETDGTPDWFDCSAVAGGTSFAAAAVAGAVAAAQRAGEDAIDTWDRVRARTVNVAASDLRGIDTWARLDDH